MMGFFAYLFGCSDNKPPRLPEILSEAEQGFVDLVFAVTTQKPTQGQ